MKISTTFKAQLLSTSTTESKDGRLFYHATIFISESGEAGQMNISEDLYKNLIVGSSYVFIGEWNDKYNTFRISGVCDE